MSNGLWLIPGTVTLHPLRNGQAQLSILFTNGKRGKLLGPEAELLEVQTALLEAMAANRSVNLNRWPAMKIGTGYELDW